jgi:hypothetical protein
MPPSEVVDEVETPLNPITLYTQENKDEIRCSGDFRSCNRYASRSTSCNTLGHITLQANAAVTVCVDLNLKNCIISSPFQIRSSFIFYFFQILICFRHVISEIEN